MSAINAIACPPYSDIKLESGESTYIDMAEPKQESCEENKPPLTVSMHSKNEWPLGKTVPSSSSRYYDRPIAEYCPGALDKSFDAYLDNAPSATGNNGWRKHIQPEGTPYHTHVSIRVTTEADVEHPETCKRISYAIDLFACEARRCGLSVPPHWEVVLSLHPGPIPVRYYIADHRARTIRFLDGASTEELDLPDVASPEHLRVQMELQFWIHLEFFPCHNDISPVSLAEITGILIHAYADQSTSSQGTSPFPARQLKEYIDLLQKIRLELPMQSMYKTCTVARLYVAMLHSRFLNLYGDRAARLAKNQSVRDSSDGAAALRWHHRALKLSISRALWRQPDAECAKLEQQWVDQIAYTEHWREYMVDKIKEWNNVAALGMLLVLADTLFITRAPRAALTPATSLVQAAGDSVGSASLLITLASVATSCVCSHVHQDHPNWHASSASEYLEKANSDALGLYPLATVLALPRALLMWGFALAACAFLSLGAQLDPAARWTLGALAALLCVLCAHTVRFLRG